MSDSSSPQATRKRTRAYEPQQPPSSGSSQATENNLPPPRRGHALRRGVPLPLQNTSLKRLIYILVTLTTLLTAYYAYRTVQYKKDAGGWWNLALGRRPSHSTGHEGTFHDHQHSGRHSVEDKINDLADALGMPSSELASAIALAVRQYVPPASLSSVSAKETGTLVRVLVAGEGEGTEDIHIPAGSAPTATSMGVMKGVVHGFDNFVGMEEP